MTILDDGTGTGNRAKVASNRLFTHAISEGESVHATEKANSYNINTGTIGLTSASDSGIFYLENSENADLVIEAVAAGVGSAGTTSDVTTVTLVRSPTSVSFSTAVDMNQNRNFGSSKTLTATAYKGAEAATITGGDDIIQFFMGSGTRLFAPINLVIPKGESMAIRMNTNTTGGTTNVYAAVVCYLKDADLKD
jgi:hypothetical protein